MLNVGDLYYTLCRLDGCNKHLPTVFRLFKFTAEIL